MSAIHQSLLLALMQRFAYALILANNEGVFVCNDLYALSIGDKRYIRDCYLVQTKSMPNPEAPDVNEITEYVISDIKQNIITDHIVSFIFLSELKKEV